jgi:hypothetical protein
MRVVAMIKATEESEAGTMSDPTFFADMGRYNEELTKAGVMTGGEGLKASSLGKRVSFSRGKTRVTDGPFAETKELIAGFWLWTVKDMDEAVAWAKKCPTPTGTDTQLELRELF